MKSVQNFERIVWDSKKTSSIKDSLKVEQEEHMNSKRFKDSYCHAVTPCELPSTKGQGQVLMDNLKRIHNGTKFLFCKCCLKFFHPKRYQLSSNISLVIFFFLLYLKRLRRESSRCDLFGLNTLRDTAQLLFNPVKVKRTHLSF